MCDELCHVTGTFGYNHSIFPDMAAQGVDRLRPLPHETIPSSEYNRIGLDCFALHPTQSASSASVPPRRSLRRLSYRSSAALQTALRTPEGSGEPYGQARQSHAPSSAHCCRLPSPSCTLADRRKRKHLLAPQPLSEYDLAGRICSVCLKYSLRQVQTDRASFRHGRLLFTGDQHHHSGTPRPSRRRRPPCTIGGVW